MSHSLGYAFGMVIGVILVIVGSWLGFERKQYPATANGRYTAVRNTEKRFFEVDGREYRYWQSAVEVAFSANGREYAFKDVFRVYDSAFLPVVGAAVEVRYDPTNPATATTRTSTAASTVRIAPVLIAGAGLVIVIALNVAMIRHQNRYAYKPLPQPAIWRGEAPLGDNLGGVN